MPRDDANKPGSLYPGFHTAVAEFFKWATRSLQIDETHKLALDQKIPVRRSVQSETLSRLIEAMSITKRYLNVALEQPPVAGIARHKNPPAEVGGPDGRECLMHNSEESVVIVSSPFL